MNTDITQPSRKKQKCEDSIVAPEEENVCDIPETKELHHEKGFISTEKKIFAIDSEEDLSHALFDSKTFFQKREENPNQADSQTDTQYHLVLCMNAPWSRRSLPNYPEVHEVKQRVERDSTSNKTKKIRVIRAIVDCSKVDNAVSMCEIGTRLPCVQLWSNGRKRTEKPWNDSIIRKTPSGEKQNLDFSIPLPLSLPFELPLVTQESSENRIRLLKNLQNQQKNADVPAGSYAIIVVSATWCAPCHKLKPQLPALSNDYKEHGTFYLCDYDEYPEVRDFYEIVKIPTIAVVEASNGSLHGALQHSDDTKIRNFLDQTMKILRLDDDF